MKVLIEELKIWEALALLGGIRDGSMMSEQRARKVLRQIGMKKKEMDEPYPEEALDELFDLLEHPDKLNKTVEEASTWMISRN